MTPDATTTELPSTLPQLLAHLVATRLASIRCPTIVAVGAADTLVPPANAAAIASRIPGAELEILADTGHALFAEDRDLVRRLVARIEAKLPS